LKRIVAVTIVSGIVLAGGLMAPALAGRQARNSNGAVALTHAGPAAAAESRRLPALKVFSNPSAAYVASTCVINLNGLTDLTVVNSVTGCGMKIRFSVPMEKRMVPDTWATWASPPFTETATPKVLYTQSELAVTLTYAARSRVVGVEVEPDSGTHTIDATFRRLSGASLGTISRSVDSSAGARLFAGRVRSTKKVARVKTLTIESDGTFAIARIRVVRP
jgi:hypothetical protein